MYVSLIPALEAIDINIYLVLGIEGFSFVFGFTATDDIIAIGAFGLKINSNREDY